MLIVSSRDLTFPWQPSVAGRFTQIWCTFCLSVLMRFSDFIESTFYSFCIFQIKFGNFLSFLKNLEIEEADFLNV